MHANVIYIKVAAFALQNKENSSLTIKLFYFGLLNIPKKGFYIYIYMCIHITVVTVSCALC